ncbi:hypothetical protein [Agrobacterium pusense]|uniref:hypothetical protein n=1 Tax=Agrobacterium pusense TaxID=648995 RepID=UPI002FDC956B
MKPDIETRIADAFASKLSSAGISALLDDVLKADAAAKVNSEKASEIALDPATRPDGVAKARKEMEDANFRRERMARARERLSELHRDAVAQEARDANAERLKAALAERDQLAKDLEAYRQHAEAIADLVKRLVENNAKLPTTELTAEHIARRGANFSPWFPDLIKGLKLPAFRSGEGQQGYLWPTL